MKNKQIINFLDELRESADDMYEIFTEGSCYRLYKILKTLYPQAEAYWSESDGHAITKIDNSYYDIGGEIKKSYVDYKEYFKIKDHSGYNLLKYKTKEKNRSTRIGKYK